MRVEQLGQRDQRRAVDVAELVVPLVGIAHVEHQRAGVRGDVRLRLARATMCPAAAVVPAAPFPAAPRVAAQAGAREQRDGQERENRGRDAPKRDCRVLRFSAMHPSSRSLCLALLLAAATAVAAHAQDEGFDLSTAAG